MRKASYLSILVRNKCSTSASNIRTAQSTEIFRSSFFSAKSANVTVSASDLDDLVKTEYVRPSLLIPVFQIAGTTLGIATKFLPNSLSKAVELTVNSAAIEQLNDCVRDAQAENNDEVVKETFKFHRDIISNSDLTDNNDHKVNEAAVTVVKQIFNASKCL